MRLEQLQYMLEVSHAKSISIAAENLYISQPALSRAIKSLEDELGVALLFRTVSGVQLTQMGEFLLPQMQEVLNQLQNIYQKVEDFQEICLEIDAYPSSLTILTLPCLVDSLLPLTLEQFAARFPSVSINTQLLDLSDPFSLPDLNSADLILSMNLNNTLDQAIGDSDFKMEPLFIDNLSVVVSSAHELAKKKFISLSDILKYKLIVHDNGACPDDFYNSFTACPEKLNLILKSNNPRAIIQLLINQQAILITNNLLIKNDYIQNIDLKIIPIRNLKSLCFCLFNPNHPHLCFIQQLIAILKFVRSKI